MTSPWRIFWPAVILAVASAASAQTDVGELAWRVPTGGTSSDFSPAVGPDGSVYSNNGDTVTAVAPDGTVRWTTPASTRKGPVTVGADGTVYAVTAGDAIIALDPAGGDVVWTFADGGGPIVGGPGVGPDGNVYAVADAESGGIGMFSLTPQGALRWSDHGDPELSDDEGNGHRIRFTSDRAFVSMVPGTGNPPPFVWAYDLDGAQQYVLGSGCDGQAIIGPADQLVSGNGLCQEIRVSDPADGTLLFAVEAPSQSPCSGMANIAVGADGAVYTAFCYRAFWAIDATGAQKWFIDDFNTYFRMDNLGVAPDDSVVLDLGRDGAGWVRAFDTVDGSLRWRIDLPTEEGEAIWSTTVPVFDAARGRAYFNARRGLEFSYLYAIDLTPGPKPADLDADGDVDVGDLLTLLAQWGACGECAADLNADGSVNVTDLLDLLAHWG